MRSSILFFSSLVLACGQAAMTTFDPDAAADAGAEHECACGPPEAGAPLPDMVRVPGGTFMMGCAPNDTACNADEKPRHEVALDTFDIDRTEVSVGDYEKCVDAKACSNSIFGAKFGLDRPVVGVSGFDAERYCEFVGKRLPTEAEWEKAARGTDDRIYPWGNEPPTCDRARFRGCVDASAGVVGLDPVGAHPSGASPYGALDMAGNASELVADRYDPDFYAVSPSVDPVELVGADTVRRGCNADLECSVRASDRGVSVDRSEDYWVRGFRCARTP